MASCLEVRVLDAAADHVELALEGVLVGDVVAGAHEQLGDPRRDRPRGAAAGGLVDRHLAPAEHVSGPRPRRAPPAAASPRRGCPGAGSRRPRRSGPPRAARSQPRRAGRRRGAGSGCPRRPRCRGRRPRPRGARGARAHAARAPRPRAKRARGPVRRRRRRRRRARSSGRTGHAMPAVGYLPVCVACSAQAHDAETNAKL